MLASEPNFWSKLWHAMATRLGRFRLNDASRARFRAYKRRFHRHFVGESDAVQLSLHGQVFRVLNLSYGGLRLAQEEGLKNIGRLGSVLEGDLLIFGLSHPLRFLLQHVDQTTVGLAFYQLSGAEEQFLTRFLYFMDAGYVLKAAPKQSLAPQYRGPDWSSYVALRGAVEVHLHMDSQGPVSEAHVYYLNGMRQDFAIFSAQSLMIACHPKRELSAREKQEVLIHVICVLIGLKQVGRTDKLDQLITLALQRLQKSQKNHFSA